MKPISMLLLLTCCEAALLDFSPDRSGVETTYKVKRSNGIFARAPPKSGGNSSKGSGSPPSQGRSGSPPPQARGSSPAGHSSPSRMPAQAKASRPSQGQGQGKAAASKQQGQNPRHKPSSGRAAVPLPAKPLKEPKSLRDIHRMIPKHAPLQVWERKENREALQKSLAKASTSLTSTRPPPAGIVESGSKGHPAGTLQGLPSLSNWPQGKEHQKSRILQQQGSFSFTNPNTDSTKKRGREGSEDSSDSGGNKRTRY